jgi:hypothetical protein
VARRPAPTTPAAVNVDAANASEVNATAPSTRPRSAPAAADPFHGCGRCSVRRTGSLEILVLWLASEQVYAVKLYREHNRTPGPIESNDRADASDPPIMIRIGRPAPDASTDPRSAVAVDAAARAAVTFADLGSFADWETVKPDANRCSCDRVKLDWRADLTE